MIKYKRIYPMKSGGRLMAVVTIVGGTDAFDVYVKFKVKPQDKNLLFILFDPKTYEYKMMPLEQQMHMDCSLGSLTACVIACRNGMFIEFIMEGTCNKGRISTSKLKSIIAMDSCMAARPRPVPEEPGEEKCVCKEQDKKEEDHHKELMDYLKQMEEGALPTTYVPKAVEAAEEARPVHVADTVMADIKNVDVHQETIEAEGKYCEFVNPFNGRWEGVWWKVQYPDKSWHYIVGRVTVDGANVSVLGVPGERNSKPVCLESCDMYAVADNGVGYWLMFQK